jgi:hypothetical protein
MEVHHIVSDVSDLGQALNDNAPVHHVLSPLFVFHHILAKS